jgi:hypothetical protein
VNDPTPSIEAPPTKRSHRARTIAIQVVGILAALASLAYAGSQAFGSNTGEQWKKLTSAPRSTIAIIFGLSAATLLVEGLSFWILVRPIKRLRAIDVIATNNLCTFLAYLPFKVSAVTRVLIHNRRDGIPIPSIMAWFAAFALVMMLTFVPAVLLVGVMGAIDGRWGVVIGAILLGACVGLLILGRWFRGDPGLERLVGFLRAIRLSRAEPLLRSQLWRNLHAGFDVFATPTTVIGSIALRAIHAVVLTARFVLVAHVLSLDPSLSMSFQLALAFFFVGAASPAGMAGLREGAVTGLAGLLLKGTAAHASVRDYAAVALVVSVTEAIVFLVGGILGLLWLRPDHLLKLRRKPVLAPDTSASASSEAT